MVQNSVSEGFCLVRSGTRGGYLVGARFGGHLACTRIGRTLVWERGEECRSPRLPRYALETPTAFCCNEVSLQTVSGQRFPHCWAQIRHPTALNASFCAHSARAVAIAMSLSVIVACDPGLMTAAYESSRNTR